MWIFYVDEEAKKSSQACSLICPEKWLLQSYTSGLSVRHQQGKGSHLTVKNSLRLPQTCAFIWNTVQSQKQEQLLIWLLEGIFLPNEIQRQKQDCTENPSEPELCSFFVQLVLSIGSEGTKMKIITIQISTSGSNVQVTMETETMCLIGNGLSQVHCGQRKICYCSLLENLSGTL